MLGAAGLVGLQDALGVVARHEVVVDGVDPHVLKVEIRQNHRDRQAPPQRGGVRADAGEELRGEEVSAHDRGRLELRHLLHHPKHAEVLHRPLEPRLSAPVVGRVVEEAEDVLPCEALRELLKADLHDVAEAIRHELHRVEHHDIRRRGPTLEQRASHRLGSSLVPGADVCVQQQHWPLRGGGGALRTARCLPLEACEQPPPPRELEDGAADLVREGKREREERGGAVPPCEGEYPLLAQRGRLDGVVDVGGRMQHEKEYHQRHSLRGARGGDCMDRSAHRGDHDRPQERGVEGEVEVDVELLEQRRVAQRERVDQEGGGHQR
mmetsp:Transcript_12509/g.26506  ORF Transcript_12509/g.26506 Transcript_12509/m.26506 type:complete len:323 (-) Transcript_12509:62-1030(-)